MKIKFLRDWTNPADQKSYKAGPDVVEIEDLKAKTLIEIGAAEEIATAGTVAEELAKALGGIETAVAAAVASGLAQAATFEHKGKRLVVTGGAPAEDNDPMNGFHDDAEFYLAVKAGSAQGAHADPRLPKIAEVYKRLLLDRYPQIAQSSEAMGKVAAVGTGAEGGFLVPEETSSRILARATARLNIMGLCDRIVLSGYSVRMAGQSDADRSVAATRYGGIIVYNVAEAGSITASDLKFREVSLQVHKKAAMCVATDEMLSVVANFGDRMTNGMGDAIGDEYVEDIMFGSGAGVCLGAFTSPACLSIAAETDQEADTLLPRNITKMLGGLAEGAQSPQWYYNPECLTQLCFLTLVAGTSGYPVFLPTGGLTGQPNQTIMGHPATKTDHCLALGDAGDICLADWSQYMLAMRGGVKTDMSIHLYFDTDRTAFRATFEVDGKPSWETTQKPRKGAAATRTAPFVKLAAR